MFTLLLNTEIRWETRTMMMEIYNLMIFALKLFIPVKYPVYFEKCLIILNDRFIFFVCIAVTCHNKMKHDLIFNSANGYKIFYIIKEDNHYWKIISKNKNLT